MLSLQELLNPIPPASQPLVNRFNTSNLSESRGRMIGDLNSQTPTASPPPSLRREPPSTPQHRNSPPPAALNISPHAIPSISQFESTLLSTQNDIRLNNKTKLNILYHYKRDTILEYPRTSNSPQDSVGHLLELSPNQWSNPRLSFAYSQGPPKGQTKEGSHVYCRLLRNDETGEEVPCRESHYTYQEAAKTPHTQVTQESFKLRVQQVQRLQSAGPAEQALLEKSLSYYRAYKVLGCLGPSAPSADQSGTVSPTEWAAQLEKFRRGAKPKSTCNGRLIFDYNYEGRAFIRCEHFSARPGGARDHLCSFEVSNGLYDTDYLEALFEDDGDAISEYENAAMDEGYGPLVSCTNVANFNTQKLNCPCEHRAQDGELILAEMLHLPCGSTVRCFEPLEAYREACPRVLIVCRGAHRHPVPLPTKTPRPIRKELFSLLERLDEDLPDLTPRRFLRHPVTLAYLQQCFPEIVNPTVAHLHVSLANRDHIKAFILQVQKSSFPNGTGWQGLQNIKDEQDTLLPPEQHYIRIIEEIPLDGMPVHEEDELDHELLVDPRRTLRIVICMTPTQSRRLSSAQYLQSDIAFKRVAGFLEFELGGLDNNSQTAITYCRAYLNRQTAAAHQIVLERINSLVEGDTGAPLKWRHLHANSLTEYTGIVHWVGDQHGGQAKGIGLYLQAVAQNLGARRDLHESHRLLRQLDPYDHLRRLYRLCVTHVQRNIHETSTPEDIKNKMRSLMCIEHPDFDGCLRAIALEGGKPAADWVQNKVSCKFALPAICWQKSMIPKAIWRVGDTTSNIIESLHADVNKEGKFCSLVGGVKKGLRFDTMKVQSLEVFEDFGIRPSYRSGHKSESIAMGIKRTMNRRLKGLYRKDAEIDKANKRLRLSLRKATAASEQLRRVREGRQENGTTSSNEATLVRKEKAASEAYDVALGHSVALLRQGSGRKHVALPLDVAENMGLAPGQPY
ncbi:hypothetical protein HWV62_696 [Athelia sp. TMB]|nr:hypothetical protein HWV62_696 [Athelia sp. TMB]